MTNISSLCKIRVNRELLLTALISYFFSITWQVTLTKAETYRNQQFHFEITYPDNLVKIDPPSENIALFLRERDADFPTFNILVEPQSFDISRSLNKLSEEIISSYRKVGIIDALPIEEKIIEINRTKILSVILSYTNNDRNFKSYIAVWPSTSRHFIHTYIGEDSSSDSDYRTFNKIIETFREDVPVQSVEDAGTSSFSSLELLGVSAGVILLLWFLQRERRYRYNN